MASATLKIALSASRDIPFNKLLLSACNVRRVRAGVSIEQLADDIARRTLLQSLTVRPVLDDAGNETGMYEIPAGGSLPSSPTLMSSPVSSSSAQHSKTTRNLASPFGNRRCCAGPSINPHVRSYQISMGRSSGMTTAPSARPPSSQRRKPDLDSDHARQFVERAASHPSTEPATGEGGEEARLSGPTVGARGSRREQLRPLTLCIPEELHSALLYIAENSSKSMNQFAIDVLTPAAAAQISKIAKRKELGLE